MAEIAQAYPSFSQQWVDDRTRTQATIFLLKHKAPDLHYIYGVLPVLVSFIAEQLRLASAQMILDARGFENAAAVGGLPEDEQRLVVRSIVLREMGVMALAAIVMLVLLIRAAGTA